VTFGPRAASGGMVNNRRMPDASRKTRTVDVLGEPYYTEPIELENDDEGEVVATLVSRTAPDASTRAVLHVHGFADYFFQRPMADYWVARGYDFYAVDLRKYGRSIREHHTANFVTDLADYYAEIDEAYRRVVERDGHDHVVISAHSTGGLITALWAHDRRPALAGMVLNSPWLDLQGSLLLRTAATKAIDQIGLRRPYLTIPRDVSGFYARSLHREHDGEWEFDLAWKPLQSWPVYAGWLRAVRRGHARAHRGLDVPAPVLVLTSDASGRPREYDETCTSTDIVLDVEQIRKWAHKLADHVTLVRVEGAIHDVTMSREPVRERAFDEISRWLDAYVS
jgi:alpha-beta hydrolase superfamily lysophospholipase